MKYYRPFVTRLQFVSNVSCFTGRARTISKCIFRNLRVQRVPSTSAVDGAPIILEKANARRRRTVQTCNRSGSFEFSKCTIRARCPTHDRRETCFVSQPTGVRRRKTQFNNNGCRTNHFGNCTFFNDKPKNVKIDAHTANINLCRKRENYDN